MSAGSDRDRKTLSAERANQRHEVMIGGLAAGNPDPAIASIRRRDRVRARGNLFRGGHFLFAIIRIARRTANRTPGQTDKTHLKTTQMSFPLDGPEYGITR